jgi:hypothetical protein
MSSFSAHNVTITDIVADGPCRASLLKCQTFTAEYGCTFCDVAQEYISETDKVLRYKANPTLLGVRRTPDSMVFAHEMIENSEKSIEHYKGVKGISALFEVS